MSIDQASPLVPIKPQVSLQNSALIKNSHNRSSFCGAIPSPTNGNGTFKTFAVNRKSWSGNVTLPLQQFSTDSQAPQLATFRSGTGTFPRNRERNNNSSSNGILTPNGNSVQTFRGNEVRRSGCSNGRRYAEIGNWSKRKFFHNSCSLNLGQTKSFDKTPTNNLAVVPGCFIRGRVYRDMMPRH
ncbi:hypothetical protein MSG28_004622 [Choristoneura fumiferana]|uniref:Uncharacterized protein n=1 Tax=Choristoneura fumiferana TaxID=7141 RepID=A0ACC0K6X8_CHOFU|nr:hypothetical protein MSG28_004622 [Choristoneura fumiferana]